MKAIKFNNKLIKVITIGELAAMCNYSVITLKKMEKRKILPQPNLRGADFSNGELGHRYYTIPLANKLQQIFKQTQQGVKISPDIIHQITVAFSEEKQLLIKS